MIISDCSWTVQCTPCTDYSLCYLCMMSLQVCQNDGGPNIFGVGSVNSATFGNVTKPGYTFTMSYSNKDKIALVAFTLDASGGTRFTFNSEDPPNTYVSCFLQVLSQLCFFLM